MNTRPILFSGPMVRALLDGRKTQTRRIVKQPRRKDGAKLLPELLQRIGVGHACPYGIPGDLLWVRECFSYCAPNAWKGGQPWYWADGNPDDGDFTKPKPSIHMPRWASRLTLEITGVHVERLQEISEADAIAEGIEPVFTGTGDQCGWLNYEHIGDGVGYCTNAVDSYASLWRHINGMEAWDVNPWVWIPAFSVHHQNVDAILKEKEAA